MTITTPVSAVIDANDAITATGDAARAYVQAGYVVHPLLPGTNRPLPELSAGHHYCSCTGGEPLVGTSDLDEDWDGWTRSTFNVGIVTGARSRLLVLEVDVKRVDGHAILYDFMLGQLAVGRDVPPHPVVASPSGGAHHWFALPEDVHVRGNPYWLPGVEVKACGQQVAAPPSVRPDGAYRWHRWLDVVPLAPEWLLADVLTRRDATRHGGVGGTGGMRSNGRLPPTSDLLREGLDPDYRDQDCFRLACRLWQYHWPDEAQVLVIVRQVWEVTQVTSARRDHEFTWRQALKCVESALRTVEPEMTWLGGVRRA